MRGTFVAEELPNKPDFTLIYDGNRVEISKFLASMFSLRLRRQLLNYKDSVMEIFDSAPYTTFLEFVHSIQGQEYEINEKNYQDLQKFAKNFQVPTLINEIDNFIHENTINSEEADKLQSAPFEMSPEMINILTENINKAYKMPMFAALPIDALRDIIVTPKANIIDHHSFLQFVTKMLEIHGPKATCLATKLDMQQLTREELLAFLDNPLLDKAALASQLFNVAEFYVNEVAVYQLEANKTKEKIADLQNYQTTDKIKNYMLNIKKFNEDLNQYNKSVEGTETIVRDMVEKASLSIDETEENIAKYSTEQNIKYTAANTHIKALGERLAQIKLAAKEAKRSPVKRPPAGIEVPETDGEVPQVGRLTPVILDPSAPLDGILSTCGDAAITASSVMAGTSPERLGDAEWTGFFATMNKESQWIAVDLGAERQAKVTDYTIRSTKYPEGSMHPVSWALEASNDGNSWEVIDERKTDALNGASKTVSFHCANETMEAARYIRLRQTGPCARGDNSLSINNIELFGILVQRN